MAIEFPPTAVQAQPLGTVVAVQANFYQVRLDPVAATEEPRYLLCTRRSRLKKIGQSVMVGDRVAVEEPDWQDGRGAIAQVLPRLVELERPPIANAEQILLVFALEQPSLEVWQLSRFLVKAESVNLELCLCLNKRDLVSEAGQQQWRARLQGWGYEPVLVSVAQNQGIGELLARLEQKITILAGPSGVGKSSLIHRLIPDAENVRVAQVSGKLGRGRHTTRHVELFELPGSGLLADSPGFNQPDMNYEPESLAQYFPEARARLAQGRCQFNDCLHRDEPNCVVRGGWERYEHYRKFLEEVCDRQTQQQQLPDEEGTLKLKVKGAGVQEYEPKLELKKYRRSSRRQRHQTLQEYENQSAADLYEAGEDWE